MLIVLEIPVRKIECFFLFYRFGSIIANDKKDDYDRTCYPEDETCAKKGSICVNQPLCLWRWSISTYWKSHPTLLALSTVSSESRGYMLGKMAKEWESSFSRTCNCNVSNRWCVFDTLSLFSYPHINHNIKRLELTTKQTFKANPESGNRFIYSPSKILVSYKI